MAMWTAPWRDIPPARRWALVWPREHGAWGILLVSLLTGATVGASSAPILAREGWLLAAAVAVFCAHTPLENVLSPDSPFRPRTTSELHWVTFFAVAFSAIGGVGLGVVADRAPVGFYVVGLVTAGILGVQAVLKRRGRPMRLLAQLTGALGLAATAAMACCVASGRTDRLALILWAANWLFATNQILYVQLRIHESRTGNAKKKLVGKRFFLGSEILTAAGLGAFWRIGLIPAGSLIAFVPALMRGAILPILPDGRPLEIRRLGKGELAHALIFAALLILSFKIGF